MIRGKLGARRRGNCRGMLRGTTIRKRRIKETTSLKFGKVKLGLVICFEMLNVNSQAATDQQQRKSI